MERWELARVKRLEDQVARLERKDWERSDFVFRLIVHGLIGALIVLAIAAILISASHAH